MPLLIPLLLIGIPVLELALMVEVASRIGTLSTVAAVIATAAVGLALVRRQGLSVWIQAQRSIDQGIEPVAEIIHALLLLLAGVALLLPGFASDLLGAALLVPALRRWVGQTGLWRPAASSRLVRVARARDGSTVILQTEYQVDDEQPRR